MSPTAYILCQPVTAGRPTRWDIHARYAIRLRDEIVELPAGSWLLVLPESADGRTDLLHYRLADGRIICLDEPLTSAQAAPLTEPQALTALSAYRPLEQAILDDWGVQVEQVDRTPPFRLIQCPLCDGCDFTTVGFADVWCDGCHTQFNVRHTAGDPGFVVDCTWRYYQPGVARYLLPRSEALLLTMVFKNSGDPLDLTHTPHCHRSDCTDKQVALTDGQDGPLRAGLHACALSDVYDWSFYGQVPTVYNHDQQGHHNLLWPDETSEVWPCTAFVSVTGFSWEDKQQMEGVAALLRGHVPAAQFDEHPVGRRRDELAACLNRLAARPSRTPHVGYRSLWPHRKHLQAGEKYLLYRWLLQQEKADGWATAVPVWLVVTNMVEDKASDKWQVVRDNICPHCGEAVTTADLTRQGDEKRPWATPHGRCRESWQRHNWQPTLLALEEAASPQITPIQDERRTL